MRINNEIQGPGTDSIQKPGADSTRKVGTVNEAYAQNSGHASVSLSGRAQEVSRYTAIAADAPEIGADRIASLRQQLASGKYKVDHEQLAGDFLTRTPAAESF